MNNYTSSLLKNWSHDSPTEKSEGPKDCSVHFKVSDTVLDELNHYAEDLEEYDSRSDLIRDCINDKLRSAEVDVDHETVRKASIIVSQTDLPSVEVVIEKAVELKYREHSEGCDV